MHGVSAIAGYGRLFPPSAFSRQPSMVLKRGGGSATFPRMIPYFDRVIWLGFHVVRRVTIGNHIFGAEKRQRGLLSVIF